MAIRPRISKAYSEELRQFERRRLRGPLPPAPPKPTKVERERFVNALLRVPVNQTFSHREFYDKYHWKYAQLKFDVWGVELCIYLGYIRWGEDRIECTGATVGRAKINREGKRLNCRLRGEPRTWYGQVIRWLSETEYGV